MTSFEKKIKAISLEKLVEVTGDTLLNPSKELLEKEISNISTLMKAEDGDISFFTNPKYSHLLKTTKASFCIIKQSDVQRLGNGIIPVISKDPYRSFALLMHLFYGESEIEFLTKGVYDQYIDATANLGKGVTLGKNVKIFSNVVISSNTIIGNNVIILPNTFIGANVKIGDNTIIHDGCSLMFCDIGNNCVIRSGARIGTSGFGFAPNLKTGKHLYIPQIAKVILGNEVDIGANTVLDRGCLEDTIVGDNTKIDNLVQIAHGVSIGKSVFIAGQTGIAGSTNVGNFVFMGAQVGVTGHIHIGDYTQIVGKSGIMHSIEENGTVVAGYPAMSKNNWQRINIKLKQLITKKK